MTAGMAATTDVASSYASISSVYLSFERGNDLVQLVIVDRVPVDDGRHLLIEPVELRAPGPEPRQNVGFARRFSITS
jgi:hypothetical protein